MRPRSWSTTIAFAFAAASLLSACDILGPDSYVALGVLVVHDDTLGSVNAPDTVSAGEGFDVIVGTLGGACDKVERTELEVQGVIALIRPYDRKSLGSCIDRGEIIGHTASVRFDAPGLGAIRVTGRQVSYENPKDTLVTLVRSVVVVR